MTAILAYQNRMESASSVTATSEATGGDVENCYDGLTHDYWQASSAGTNDVTIDLGSAQNVDYWACFAHDLADNSGSITLQYSSDNFAADVNTFGSTVTPSGDELIFRTGSTVSERYWRFRIQDSTTASKIGVLMLGTRVDLPVGMVVGFVPPKYGRKFEYLPQLSESGQFIGRSLKRRAYETEIHLQYVSAAWPRATLDAFLTHADGKPFMFCWDNENYQDEAAFCWLRDNVQPNYSKPTLMDVRLPVGCLV